VTALTDEDLAVLARVKSVKCESPVCNCALVERDIADEARRNAPDVDDSTLAKVLLDVARQAGAYANHNDLTGIATMALVGRAAAELAALELGDPNA
jgi:hypothetical protein